MHCLIDAMEKNGTQTSCTNDLQSTKTTQKDIFFLVLSFLFIFFLSHMRHLLPLSSLVLHYSCSFVILFLFSPPCAALFLESQLYLSSSIIIIINIYIYIYFFLSAENKPSTKNKHSALFRSFCGDVHVFLFKTTNAF